MLINHLDSSFWSTKMTWFTLQARGVRGTFWPQEGAMLRCGSTCCNRLVTTSQLSKTFCRMFTLPRGRKRKGNFIQLVSAATAEGESWSRTVNLKTSPTVAGNLNSCLHVTSNRKETFAKPSAHMHRQSPPRFLTDMSQDTRTKKNIQIYTQYYQQSCQHNIERKR